MVLLNIGILFVLFRSGESFYPWLQRSNSTNEYKFLSAGGTWDESQEKCRAEGGDLVSLNDQAELSWVLSHYNVRFNTDPSKQVYIYVALTNENQWETWLDGNPVNRTLTPWKAGRPTGLPNYRCAALEISPQNLLVDILCYGLNSSPSLARYVCERSTDVKTLRPGQSLSPIITNEIIGNAAIENEKSISSQAGLPVDNTDKRSLWRTAGVGSRLGKGNFNLLDSQMDSVHCKASPPSSHGRKNIPQNKQFIATALSMLVIALMYAS